METSSASSDGLPNPPIDARLVQRTTAAVLSSASGIAERYVAKHARKAGADDRSLNRFVQSASLPPATKEMMVEISPDVLAGLGMDPKSYPMTVFLGGLGLWAANIWLVVDELKALKKPEPVKTAPPTSSPAAASPALPIVLPDPKPPKGGPPVLT